MVTVGIVGAGIRGRMYAEALRGLDGVAVLALAEPDSQAAASAHHDTGIPVVGSYDELLQRHDPDAIIVATPDFAHRGPAVAAAEAGKHLLIEKPLATTLDDARAIADAVRRGGATCTVGFENRWNPHVHTAQRNIAAGEVGDHITSSATLSNSWYVPTRMLRWSARSSPAWFLMPHTVDMLLWFTGRQPVSVSAVASRGQLAARGIDTDDVVHALLTYDDGTTSSLTSAWTLPDAHPAIVDFRFRYIGTAGTIAGDPIRQGLDLVADRPHSLPTLGHTIGRAAVGAPVWMAQEFALNLRDGLPTGPGIEQGLLVTEVISAIERACRDGRSTPIRARSAQR
ncbi:MAG: Gfo/Idh/MocA family protein [Mycobacteriales bacterium]